MVKTIQKIPVAGIVAKGLIILRIDTVENISAETPIPATAAISLLFDIQPLLMQIDLVGMRVNETRAAES